MSAIALSIFIDSPENGDTVGLTFCATGTYATSVFGPPYITCSIQGNTYVATILADDAWNCTCTANSNGEADLIARIYDAVGGTLYDSQTVTVTVDNLTLNVPCP
jgi:hypothetical protein